MPARRSRLAGVLVAALALLPSPALSAPVHTATPALVRVDQVGYGPAETKQAYLMTGTAAGGARFRVLDAATGHTVYSGHVGTASRGAWNARYPHVYPIDFTGLRTRGRYRIAVSGGATATSPPFRVLDPAGMYGALVADGVSFYQVQRDGAHVIPGALHRQPAHLGDARTSVYAWPHYETADSDVITDADLTRLGGPVDVAGGWFDAGDYLKFTHSTAYGDVLLFASERALGDRAPSTLDTEAQYGASWLGKVWDEHSRTLYLQVGIGSGNTAGTFTGDHDLWRLPQADDADTDPADRYAAAHRPVFRAADPGQPISPNLVGRVSAAFALAAQVDARRDPNRARTEYAEATSLYAMAATASPPDPLVTALPHAFYPEDTWHDDMELGGAEIALAAQRLHRDATPYLAAAARWAAAYLASDTGDTFNLYDTSALAHADLIRAMAAHRAGLPVTRQALVADLKRQLGTGATRARDDIFRAGGVYTDFDVDSHTFGFLTTEALYRGATGDTSFTGFATAQRDWLLGANAWGTSFMVGEGSTFPHCMQHQVANLSGSTDGSRPVATGAVVNGPNDPAQFQGGLGDYQDGMVPCPPSGADPYAAFNGHGSRFVDDVRAWQTAEPALDMTGAAILGAALQESAR